MAKVDTAIFDWGGVLIEDPAPGLMAYCAQALGVSVPDYVQAHQVYASPFQTGKITEADFWDRVCVTLGCDLPRSASLWGEAFRQVYTPRSDVFDLATRLQRQRIMTCLLSNTEAPVVAYFGELGYTMFDHAVFSCIEGCQKPDPDIYAIAVEKCNTTAQQCLFIDDRPDFVQGALDAGLQAVLFDQPLDIVARLCQRFDLPG